MLEACLDLDPVADQVAVARAFVRATLAAWDMNGYADDATVVVSELATNAVLHARTPFRIFVRAHDMAAVWIEVADDNPRPPLRAADDVNATSGRGLQAVVALAAEWGIRSEHDGKIVWAKLGENRPVDPDCIDLRGIDSTADAIDEIERHLKDAHRTR